MIAAVFRGIEWEATVKRMMMRLFRSVVTIVVVGTMAAMIFSLRSELAAAKTGAGRDGAGSVIADRPHVFSMSCKVPSCNVELSTEAGRARAIEWFRRNRITGLWLESYRHGEKVETELLEEERDAFRAAGFEVCGMITPTKLNNPPEGGEAPFVVCWSDPKAWRRLAEESARAAKVFGTVIIDDFLFSGCDDGCARCKALKAKQGLKDWGVFRRELMKDVAGRCIIRAGRSVNPKVRFIIKYPCWYQDWAKNGYDPMSGTRMFGECWIGTETRDANPDPVQGCCLVEAMDRLTDGRCGGGWYDALDCSPEKFVEQARYTIIGGARESLVHCYDYLIAKDPGSTPFGEKADRSHACAEAFTREVDGLARLAELLRGAERTGWGWLTAPAGNNTGVSIHGFRKDGRRYVVCVNTTGEWRMWTCDEGRPFRKVLSLPDGSAGRVMMDGPDNPAVELAPHGLLVFEDPNDETEHGR